MMKKAVVGILMVAGVCGTGLADTNMVAAAAPVPAASWADSLTFKGDFRYRNETINDDSRKNAAGETYTRQRDRIRVRLSAEAKCNENLNAGLGLSTGGSDPLSGSQSIGDGGQKKDMTLYLAYFDYSFVPGSKSEEVHAVAGKMRNPFITMSDDLIWDPDHSPEGLALRGSFTRDAVTTYGNAGYIWVQERDSKSPAKLYAGQGAVKYEFCKEASLTVGASYFGFQDIEGYDVIDWQGQNNSYGNSTKRGSISGTTTNKAWATGFTPVVYFASLDMTFKGVPVSIFSQELSNTDASDFDQGHMYGICLGKAKKPGSVEVGYSYAELQKDATIGMWTDSTRWGGGTDAKGHKVYVRYQFMKNFQAAVTYHNDDKNIASGKATGYDRLMFDLVAAF